MPSCILFIRWGRVSVCVSLYLFLADDRMESDSSGVKCVWTMSDLIELCGHKGERKREMLHRIGHQDLFLCAPDTSVSLSHRSMTINMCTHTQSSPRDKYSNAKTPCTNKYINIPDHPVCLIRRWIKNRCLCIFYVSMRARVCFVFKGV